MVIIRNVQTLGENRAFLIILPHRTFKLKHLVVDKVFSFLSAKVGMLCPQIGIPRKQNSYIATWIGLESQYVVKIK